MHIYFDFYATLVIIPVGFYTHMGLRIYNVVQQVNIFPNAMLMQKK
jgi:hypothetical protein